MNKYIKENFSVVLAFSLPIALILALTISIYLPSFFISTNYNFVYATCSDGINSYRYLCTDYINNVYTIKEGKLIISNISPSQDTNNNKIADINENYTARLFLHDTKSNESREISLDEAKTLTFNSLLTSPDGVTVSSFNDNRGYEIFNIFGNNREYGYYLTKGNRRKRINLVNQDNSYYYKYNFKFIGWVLPGRI